MKLRELLSESDNYMGQLNNDLNAYLVRLKANDITSIGTDILVRELEDLNYSITPEALVDLLADNKYVQTVTVDTVELVGAPPAAGQGAEDNAEKVEKSAVKTAQKKIGKRF